MAARYRITVFGKAGCDKCKVLNQRLDSLLAREEWSDFEKQYADLDSIDGLLHFCKAECVNPQRVPAMLVSRRDEATGRYLTMCINTPGRRDDACGDARLYQFLGLQTDYSDKGRGVISPDMIAAVLEEARAL